MGIFGRELVLCVFEFLADFCGKIFIVRILVSKKFSKISHKGFFTGDFYSEFEFFRYFTQKIIIIRGILMNCCRNFIKNFCRRFFV
jgi:hypothetical protein